MFNVDVYVFQWCRKYTCTCFIGVESIRVLVSLVSKVYVNLFHWCRKYTCTCFIGVESIRVLVSLVSKV